MSAGGGVAGATKRRRQRARQFCETNPETDRLVSALIDVGAIRPGEEITEQVARILVVELRAAVRELAERIERGEVVPAKLDPPMLARKEPSLPCAGRWS